MLKLRVRLGAGWGAGWDFSNLLGHPYFDTSIGLYVLQLGPFYIERCRCCA
jgi:hypothetical protein